MTKHIFKCGPFDYKVSSYFNNTKSVNNHSDLMFYNFEKAKEDCGKYTEKIEVIPISGNSHYVQLTIDDIELCALKLKSSQTYNYIKGYEVSQ